MIQHYEIMLRPSRLAADGQLFAGMPIPLIETVATIHGDDQAPAGCRVVVQPRQVLVYGFEGDCVFRGTVIELADALSLLSKYREVLADAAAEMSMRARTATNPTEGSNG